MELRKVSLQEALAQAGRPMWPHASSYDPTARMFEIAHGQHMEWRSDLSSLGLEVVFTEEELRMQGQAGVLREIKTKAAELEGLIHKWMNAPR